MSTGHDEILCLRLRCDVTAPRLARKALEGVTEISPVREDALLVASELTTNAVLHSGSDSSAEIEIRAQLRSDAIVIEVIDEGRSDTSPHTQPTDSTTPGGFGLPVVTAIARSWGSERQNRLRVWAELAL